LSSNSTTSLVRVAESNKNGLRWFQLYVTKDRDFTKQLTKMAENTGYTALVLTVDAPILGNRIRDSRIKFSIPNDVSFEIIEEGRPKDNNNYSKSKESNSYIFNYFKSNIDDSLDWNIISWLKSITKLDIILKGVHRVDDALIAAEKGVKGIIVSNHGGRQLDTVLSTIEMLFPISNALKNFPNVDLYVDGGIRRGSDVFKALALGAKAVFIGRPILWGLAVGGEQGIKKVYEILIKELILCMRLSGCISVSDIKNLDALSCLKHFTMMFANCL